MTAQVITIIAGVLVLGACALAAWFFIRMRELETKLEKTKESVTQTSKLLIEKNIELFDQSLGQQKELSKKDDFIAIASHQLRTPLNEVMWTLDDLISTAADADLRAKYERTLGSAKRMHKIIEDLLGFVQVDQGHSRRSVPQYEPDPLILANVQRLEADFKDTGVKVETHLLFKEKINSIDAESLEMIISNLVENAFHYTPRGGRITVSTRTGEYDTFELEVADTGIGIPESAKSNVFTKFKRSPKAIERNKEGSGLGLYIIKTLLDLSGGTIRFESTEGKGTKFRVHLPKKNVAE